MLKPRYQRLIAITLFLDFAVSLGCGLQFAMIGGEGEMTMYYLNANLISLYIQPGQTVMAAVQILSFRSLPPLLAPRGKKDYIDQLCIKIKYPFFIIVFASTVPILYHYWLEKTWLLPKYANIYDPLWRAIHHMYIL